MSHTLTRETLKTTGAAAVAGIVFSVLLLTSQLLVWVSIPPDPTAPASELARHSREVGIAVTLLPFAGIAFLWFIGVVRNHLGELEDRLFATVLLGSGLLYVATMLVGGAVAGALVTVLGRMPESIASSGVYAFGRATIYLITRICMNKMAAVFMMSTSTIFMRTRLIPRILALLGYAMALVLLLMVGSVNWAAAVFPLWVALISGYILLRQRDSRQYGSQRISSDDQAAD